MKAWRLNDSTVKASLIEEDISAPVPGDGEVLVRVHAAGVTPTELEWFPTTHTQAGGKRLRAIPGHEFSGTVAALGAGTTGVAVGAEVYGMNDWFEDGATAEYCLTRAQWIAPRPQRLTYAEAATVPISALTALQGLFFRANLRAGERVLVHGGSGAVGVFAIQLALRRGARVITTASARNKDFLLQLGAEQAIDYRTERFEEIVNDVDVVFDGVGGETLRKSWGVLKPTGRLVTIASNSESAVDARTKQAFFIVEPNRDQLIMIGQMLESGELRPVVDALVPFERAAAAYAGHVSERLGRGKVAVAMLQ